MATKSEFAELARKMEWWPELLPESPFSYSDKGTLSFRDEEWKIIIEALKIASAVTHAVA